MTFRAGGDGAARVGRVRVLVVDDHDVVYWGLRFLLSRQPWSDRCIGARNRQEALRRSDRYEPHVALIELAIGGGESGVQVAQELRRARPSLRTVFLSGSTEIGRAAARAAGASGVMSKSAPAIAIVDAIRLVADGASVFPRLAERTALDLRPREHEVLSLMARGATNREIAAALHLSPNTVKDHATSLLRKLGARNRTDAVRRAEQLGLISGAG